MNTPNTAPPMSRSLRERSISGETTLGVLVRVPSVHVIDMAGLTGYDFVLLDTEHGIADQRDIAEHITAARAAGLPVIVRVGENEPALVLRVLDAGAAGIVVPHVSSADQAELAVQMAHYPPRGVRGFATYTPAGHWGLRSAREHAAFAAATTIVVAMVEDAAGVEAAGEICATDGVDALFVGPADLAASMSHDTTQADVARLRAWSAAREHRTPVMAIVSTAEQASVAADQGATLIVLNAQAAFNACLAQWVDDGPRPERGPHSAG